MNRIFLAIMLAANVTTGRSESMTAFSRAVYRIAILNDVSTSMASGCPIVAALAEDSLSLPSLPGSTLMYFSTGDRQTTYEPSLLVSYRLPGTTRVFEAKDFRKEKQRILDNMRAECEKSRTTNISPIFQATKTITEQMQSMGCDKDVHCLLLARTDGRETANLQVREALSNAKIPPTRFPAVIDNKDVDVRICGLAQTKGQVVEADGKMRTFSQPRSEQLERVWHALFTHPERVTLQPLCISGATTRPNEELLATSGLRHGSNGADEQTLRAGSLTAQSKAEVPVMPPRSSTQVAAVVRNLVAPTEGSEDFECKLGSSGQFESGWCDLSRMTDFKRGDRVRLRIGGDARLILLRFLRKGSDPNAPSGFEGPPLRVPKERVIEVVLDGDHRETVQISVHGGPSPWGIVSLGGDNGPATLLGAERVQ